VKAKPNVDLLRALGIDTGRKLRHVLHRLFGERVVEEVAEPLNERVVFVRLGLFVSEHWRPPFLFVILRELCGFGG
jgi:hypothetical protein